MPLELGIWRIDGQHSTVQHHRMDNEKRLEELIESDIAIIAPHLMIIGRQVPKAKQQFFCKFADVIGSPS